MPGFAQFGLLPVLMKRPGIPQATFQASGPPSCRAQLHRQVQQRQRHKQSKTVYTFRPTYSWSMALWSTLRCEICIGAP